MSILLQNQSGGDIWIKLATSPGAVPVATADADSLLIPDGGSYSTTDYTGAFAAIAGGAVELTVVEV